MIIYIIWLIIYIIWLINDRISFIYDINLLLT